MKNADIELMINCGGKSKFDFCHCDNHYVHAYNNNNNNIIVST